MNFHVLSLKDIDQSMVELAGGKGASLGELSAIEGIRVPEGFCISTEAFRQAIETSPSIIAMLDRLSLVKVGERDHIRALSNEICTTIKNITIPKQNVAAITDHIKRLGEENAYAVRSSATTEDLPTASFAGQQQSYLNIIGKEAILEHISKCWASLFTERAITYRLQNGIDHREVYMAVIVQKMVFPHVAGVLFTADPVTGHRKVTSIDASFGLGEALVLGHVNADTYQVRDGKIIDKKVSDRQALTDEQIVQLERIGKRIEQHFGWPQDIEWCLKGDAFYIVQSRPITTLYPIPKANDQDNHVYVSVGHQQMMTDAMKPLGLSFFLLTTSAPMCEAGGRLFVDVTPMLASAGSREAVINALGQSDPLIKDALLTIVVREDFIKHVPNHDNGPQQRTPKSDPPFSPMGFRKPIENDPTIVADLIKRSQTSIEALRQNIQTKSGPELFDFILEDIQHLKKLLFDPQSMSVIMAAMDASAWLNEKMEAWLGEKKVADTLSQAVPNNVTAEMGLELLDVADVIRPYPEVIDYLRAVSGRESGQVVQQASDHDFLDELVKFKGGQEAQVAINAYLDKYGMRCVGEIDITRPRWSEKPTMLIPALLNHIKNFDPGAHQRKVEQGRQEALKKEQALLERLRQLPDGSQKVEQTKQMIDLLRQFIGYREYPKYSMVQRYFVYKQALLIEADRLVHANVIEAREDIYHLTFEELRDVVRTHRLDHRIISKRKDEYKRFEKLTPPRVMTSDGETIFGEYRRENLPPNAIVGLAVSAGVVEGRARVIFKPEDADLEEGDILVTPFTDPSWIPWFVSIKGLVTEVGGLMTHGAVIAREYGLPAVVGVLEATKRIKDGQRIRVHGTEGYVEIL